LKEKKKDIIKTKVKVIVERIEWGTQEGWKDTERTKRLVVGIRLKK